MCKKVNKSIVNRFTNTSRYFAGVNANYNYVLASPYHVFEFDVRPENFPADHDPERIDTFTNIIDTAENNCTLVLELPDIDALKAYQKAENAKRGRHDKNKFVFDFGNVAINIQYLIDIMTVCGKNCKIAIAPKDGNKKGVYFVGDGVRGVVMPVQRKENANRTDLSIYTNDENNKPWFLRDDANQYEPDPIPWNASAHFARPEDEADDDETRDEKPREYVVTRTNDKGKECTYAKFTTMTKASAKCYVLTHLHREYKFTIYARGAIFKSYLDGIEIVKVGA